LCGAFFGGIDLYRVREKSVNLSRRLRSDNILWWDPQRGKSDLRPVRVAVPLPVTVGRILSYSAPAGGVCMCFYLQE
jgi:hypothetical protein